MVVLRMSRQEAEALYDAGIEILATAPNGFLMDALTAIRLDCGMSKTEEEAVAWVKDATNNERIRQILRWADGGDNET